MTALTQETIQNALKDYIDPYLQKDLVSAKCIKNIAIADNKVTLDIELGFPCQSHQTSLIDTIKSKINALDGTADVSVTLHHRIARSHRAKAAWVNPLLRSIWHSHSWQKAQPSGF